MLGWTWEPEDRPTFDDILKELNSMFNESGVSHGNTNMLFVLLTK